MKMKTEVVLAAVKHDGYAYRESTVDVQFDANVVAATVCGNGPDCVVDVKALAHTLRRLKGSASGTKDKMVAKILQIKGRGMQ